MRSFSILVLALCICPWAAPASSAHTGPPSLPDVAALLHDIEAHQKALDRVREDYTFRKTETMTVLDRKGKVRKVETREHYDFFVNGHEVQKLIRKDGKPLSPGDARKEEERATKEAEKFANSGSEHAGKDEITVSRLLEIIRFSNERRLRQDGRNRIALDFLGDPHARTHGRNEEAVKRVYGTLLIDEDAREVVYMQATFDDNLRIGFGLLATLEKGSNLFFNQALIRNEVWLPTAMDGHFDGKALLFMGLHVNISVRYDDYRKFDAHATEQSEVSTPPLRP